MNPPITSPWSGPTTGTYYYPTLTPPLRITEIMYHPPVAPPGNATNDTDNFEYVEFKNISAAPLNVTGYRLRGGVSFDFPALTLTGGQSCVVVADRTGFLSRYGTGILIAGSYTNNPGQNRLGNSGDHLKLEGFYHEPILDFDYSDGWYPTTDGAGFALQIVNENAATDTWGLKESWRPSGSPLGTPGTNDTGAVAFVPVLINEILTHTDLPQVDAIELYNPTASPASVGGWFLTDDSGTPKKYRIADGASVPANSYLVLYASNSFGSTFELSSRGEEVYLLSGDANTNLTGYVHGFDFGPQANGVTFGRYVTSQGGDQYPAQSAPSLGSANASPKVGPIVFSEIMYHPPDIATIEGPRDNNKDEYIELENITGASQPLYDPLFPANTWRVRDAVSFIFPTNVMIPAHGHLLLVSFDPVADPFAELSFRARNTVFGNTPVFGPYEGQLDNSSDSVELVRPDLPQPPGAPDVGAVYYILVDKVNYSDTAPWDSGADGLGFSLQRIVPSGFGNDATNWMADLKTPGSGHSSGNAPVFTQQPQSLTVVGNQPAMFSVTATGVEPISYLWLFNNSGIPGALNRVYLIPSTTVAQAGTYRCLAQGANGSSSFSSNATLTVLVPVSIGTQPLPTDARAGTNAATASNVTFSVTADSPRPISYQWRFNSTNIPWGTSRLLTVTNVQAPDDGLYSVVCTDAISSVTSDSVRLTVLINPYFIQLPVNQTAVEGDNVTFSVIAGGTQPFGYRWRKSASTIVGQVTNFLTITNVTLAMHSNALNSFEVIVTNKALPGGMLSSGNVFSNRVFILIATDADGNKLPDDWEMNYFGATGVDPNADPDHDTFSNRDEYIAGTDPIDGGSYPRITQITNAPPPMITFQAQSNRTYTLQYKEGLNATQWFKLFDVASRTNARVESVLDPKPGSNRVYRLVVPAQ